MDTTKIGTIMYEDEWLKIILTEIKPKTRVCSVMSKCSDCKLGEIKWYPAWRHYCYFPNWQDEFVYSDRCMLAIGTFLLNSNKEHNGK